MPLDTLVNTGKDYEQELINAIKKNQKDNKWWNTYFDLIREMLTEFGIDENTTKISMSVTKQLKMPITIGQRYIVHPSNFQDTIGFILPLEFEDVISDYQNQVIDQRYFYDKDKNPETYWVEFESDIIFSDKKEIFDNWKKASKVELEKTIISGFRKFHNPFYYKAAMDLNYRRKLLESIISTENNKTYLFTWNSKPENFENFDQCIEELKQKGECIVTWRCKTKAVKPGDRVFLIKIGAEPKGIIGSGITTTYTFECDDPLCVEIKLDILLNKDKILGIDILKDGILSEQNWTPQASGISIKSDVVAELEKTWFNFLASSGKQELSL